MVKTRLFKTAFILLVIVGVLYLVGIQLYLGWTIWWYDMLLHFLAGVVVGIATLLFLQKVIDIRLHSNIKVILFIVTSAFIVGVLWEIYELYFELTFLSDGIDYVRDTTSDLILDITGSLLGVFYGREIWKRN